MYVVFFIVGVFEGLVCDVEFVEGFGLFFCVFDFVFMNFWFGVFCVV